MQTINLIELCKYTLRKALLDIDNSKYTQEVQKHGRTNN